MAFVGNIRVPTLGEMENARDEEVNINFMRFVMQMHTFLLLLNN